MKIYNILLAITAFFTIISCGKDELVLPPKYVPKGPFDSGVLILNQGNATQNATLSYMSFDLGILKNNILSGISSSPNIGSSATDISVNGDFAYVVSSTDNKIEILNRYNMAKVGTISTGLNNPKYIAISNGKAFVTNWGNPTITTDDFVAIIDLNTNLVTNSIAVEEGPGRILSNNGKLYIAQTGGENLGNKVILIKVATNAVSYINVADEPNTMQIDNGNLWVLCEGNRDVANESTGSLIKININTDVFSEFFEFPTRLSNPEVLTSPVIYQHPSNLYISGTDVIYTKSNSVFKMSLIPVVTDPATVARVFYPTVPKFTLPFANVSCFTIKNNYLYYGGYDLNNTAGKVNVYSNGFQDLGAIGTLIKSNTVGIVPNGFAFNQ